MRGIQIHQECVQGQELEKLCPFGAIIKNENGEFEISAACRVCKLCVKNGPTGMFVYVEDIEPDIDRSLWNGIMVYVEHSLNEIHPVTFELIGKARVMADKSGQPVFAFFCGKNITQEAEDLLYYGVDEVFVYDDPAFEHFRIEPYSAALEDSIQKNKPSSILVGGTTIGRSLAPRVAARLRTGLTADCTVLDMQSNTDLDQIRPAFGGNIMAHILTQNRPQFATVRYKIFSTPLRQSERKGRITNCQISRQKMTSKIQVLEVHPKPVVIGIEHADIILAAGRGIHQEKDMNMIRELAEKLGGVVAVTRPLVEAGWADPRTQIGLSGRTVRPKMIITCGISGAVQFVAGINGSDCIVSINSDPNAPIFKVANYALIGDLYEVIPLLISNIDSGSILDQRLLKNDLKSGANHDRV